MESLDSLTPAQIDKLASLKPGTVLDVQISTPTAMKRVKTEYIGIYQDQYLLINYPDPRKWGGMQDHIIDGKKVVVRYILEGENGEVVAFRSKIAAVVGHPVKMFFINFPNQIESLSLREQPRIKTLLPAELDVEGLALSGMVVDISLTGSGLVLKTKDKIPMISGQRAALTLQTNDTNNFVFNGSICNQRMINGIHHLGVKFDDKDDQVHELFDKLLIDVSLLEEKF